MGNEVVKELPIDWDAEGGRSGVVDCPVKRVEYRENSVFWCLSCPNLRGFRFNDNGESLYPVYQEGECAHSVRCAHPSFQEVTILEISGSGDDGLPCAKVGRHGVTKIVCYGEPSQYCEVPWFAVYVGDDVIARVNGAMIEEVQYDY